MASSCPWAHAADAEGASARRGALGFFFSFSRFRPRETLQARRTKAATRTEGPEAWAVGREPSCSARSSSSAHAWTKAGCPNGEPRTTTPRQQFDGLAILKFFIFFFLGPFCLHTSCLIGSYCYCEGRRGIRPRLERLERLGWRERASSANVWAAEARAATACLEQGHLRCSGDISLRIHTRAAAVVLKQPSRGQYLHVKQRAQEGAQIHQNYTRGHKTCQVLLRGSKPSSSDRWAWQMLATKLTCAAVDARVCPYHLIDASHSRHPLVKGERLVRYEVNAVIQEGLSSPEAKPQQAKLSALLRRQRGLRPLRGQGRGRRTQARRGRSEEW